MLSETSIMEFAKKWQTSEQNVAREYFQHLFLSAFYSMPKAEHIAFKGGTALRILYNSPRFSEDLDFTGDAQDYHLKSVIEKTAANIGLEGFDIILNDSKPTTGGWFAILETNVYSWPVRVELNISRRAKRGEAKAHIALVSPEIVSSYTVTVLETNLLVEEKINALLNRKKPRDFFDLYYMLRSRIGVDVIARYQAKLLDEIKRGSEKSFTSELKVFLPRSYWNVVNKLTDSLIEELKRF